MIARIARSMRTNMRSMTNELLLRRAEQQASPAVMTPGHAMVQCPVLGCYAANTTPTDCSRRQMEITVSSFTARYFLSLGNVAFSLVLGVLAIALCAMFYEDTALQLLKLAGGLREWIFARITSPKMEFVARLVLHESAIMLMGFTMLSRIVVGAVITFFAWLFTGRVHAEV